MKKHFVTRLRRMAAMAAVIAASAAPAVAIETAGTVFVNVDAATFSTGATTWANAGSYGLFETVGAPQKISIAGTPTVLFDGIDDAFVGREPAPDGLVGENPTRTIEAWVFNPSIASEETVVSWGKRGGGNGTNMAFNYGNHGMFGAVGHWGGDQHDVGWIDNGPAWTAGAPDANKWHHLVYTYDGETTRLYSDGELWNEEATLAEWGGLNTHSDTAIAIASQWEGNGVDLTGGLKGSLGIGRLRIHDGVLQDAQILANYNAEKASFSNPAPPPAPVPESLKKGPIHRYSFSNAASPNATGGVLIDSVGGKNGVVVGDGSSFTGTALKLDGGPSASAAYGDLPNGLISKLTDATIESWVTIDGTQSWGRIFDFGSTDVGGVGGELEEPGGGGAGLDYVALTASRGTETQNHRLEVRNEDPAGGGAVTIDFTDQKVLPYTAHYTVVYDSDGTPFTGTPELRVYRNGELMNRGSTSIKLSDINDVNNWLGRSNWTGDANFDGKFDEFRIYDYALSQNEILGNDKAGADKVNLGGPSCDFNGNGSCDSADMDELSAAVRSGSTNTKYDLDQNGVVNNADRDVWVRNLKKTWYGDANLDGLFNSTDFVGVFQIGEYEDSSAGNTGWAEGDWNGDAEFSSSDFVAAFQDGGYDAGPRAGVAAVPEPAGLTLLASGLLGLWGLRRPRRA